MTIRKKKLKKKKAFSVKFLSGCYFLYREKIKLKFYFDYHENGINKTKTQVEKAYKLATLKFKQTFHKHPLSKQKELKVEEELISCETLLQRKKKTVVNIITKEAIRF